MNKTKKEKKAKNKEKPNLLLPKTKPAEMKEKKNSISFHQWDLYATNYDDDNKFIFDRKQ